MTLGEVWRRGGSMLQKMLENQYGIKVEEYIKLDAYDALRANGWVYLISKPIGREEEDLSELERIAQHLRNFGDYHVPAFLPTKDGTFITTWERDQYCVLANRQTENQKNPRLGRKLAKFHERGRSIQFSVERSSRIGQWKELWEKRLEQMEKVWNGLLFQTPEDEFERMFIESFPYYMGLTENAIQYLVDTEIDDQPIETDSGTVCHERFTKNSWGLNYLIKNPFDWVFDHRSRDLAEWTRERYFRNIQTYDQELKLFFSEYQSISPLSAFSWRLLYARLLFPLHYYECIENYYISRSEQQKKVLEEQLSKILRQSTEYESFLSHFYLISGAPTQRLHLPLLEWLVK
jgi:spore coat protein YutH